MSRSRRRAALLALVGAAAAATPAHGAGTAVTIADSGTPMSRIGAELVGQTLTAGGFTVTRVGLASAAAADAAQRTGTVDAYVTETATLLERVLARPKERTESRLTAVLTAALAARGQTAVGVAPYDDAPQVACRRAAVRAHRLSGLATLGRSAPRLTYAASPSHVVRADGLAALRVRFRRVVVAPGAGRFAWIANGRAHCVLSSGIEPRSARLSLVPLSDRFRRLAGTPQHGVLVAGDAYLATAPPAFADAARRAAALLTTPNARAARGAVEVDGQDPATAAQVLLRAGGVIP